MKRTICLLLSLSLASASFCQDYQLPANYRLETKTDYSNLEKEVISATDWLLGIPFNEQSEKRKEVSTFVVRWINGSPTVTVEINPTIMDFEKKNPGFLVIYMAASARFVLQHHYSTDVRARQKAAFSEMIRIYQAGKGIQKDKKLEKLAKSEAEGKMDEWLDSNMKIDRS